MICFTYSKAWYEKVMKAIASEDISSDDLYIIKAGKYYKIGRTKDLEHRMSVFQTACPYKITCVVLIRNKGFTERYLHFLMSDHSTRKNGEWFKDCHLFQKLILDLKQYSKPLIKRRLCKR